ncbi:hypothetical protein KUCAC02_024310 [Chaenocephalus aceratus]|uniref:Uncharacterized protein n=1 Tax=Chaenocephalus aceratus TaxID=36190 RepID=A0ACB9WHS8_CHAAC|nr:hypothetical protein KUCAC02_024310 [Chaenocephalus aceratus]
MVATTGHGCKPDPCLEGALKLSSTCMIDTGGGSGVHLSRPKCPGLNKDQGLNWLLLLREGVCPAEGFSQILLITYTATPIPRFDTEEP